MAPYRRPSIAALLALPLAIVASVPVQAQTAAPPAHVRSLSREASDLLTAGRAGSTVIRHLIDRLEASDLVVYLDLRWLPDGRSGRLTFVTSAAGIRYAMISVACGRIRADQIGALGHELRHAVEVAEAGDVVDQPSLARLYARIGRESSDGGSSRAFETDAAIDAGRRVRGELFAFAERER